jgi:hypothetical protein
MAESQTDAGAKSDGDVRGRASPEMRIAILGTMGALFGALVGGLVTWLVTSAQIDSQRHATQRAELVQVYTAVMADDFDLITQAGEAVSEGIRPSPSKLFPLHAKLVSDLAILVVIAPPPVEAAANEVGSGIQGLIRLDTSQPFDRAKFQKALSALDLTNRDFIRAARSSL